MIHPQKKAPPKITMGFIILFGLLIIVPSIYGISHFGPATDPSPASTSISTLGSIFINHSFGMTGHDWGYDPVDADAMAAAGMQLDRADFTWSRIEHSKGFYDFSWYDTLNASLSNAGVEILAILDYGNALYGADAALHVVTTEQVNAWLAFVNATVRQYPSIHQWEIWNEPNLGVFWDGTDEQFFYLLNATAALIHSIDPNLMIVSPGISGHNPDYLDHMISYIGDNHFSEWFGALAFHPYSGSDAEVVATSIESVQAVCSQHHFYGELWITEWGYATTRDPSYISQDLILQGSLLTKVYALSLARNVSEIMWYSFREDGFGTQYDPDLGYNMYGPTGHNVMNPAGHAFATLSSLLTNSTYLPAAITLITSYVPSSQLWVYAFLSASGHLVIIAWNSLGPYTLSISSPVTILNAWQHDPLTGSNTTLSPQALSIPIGIETPVIVEIEFSGTPTAVGVQILPTVYSGIVIFALPAFFIAGLVACIWTYLKEKRNKRN